MIFIGNPREKNSHWHYVRLLLPYLWPKDELWMRFRVVLSLLCLLGGRVAIVLTPLAFKSVVNSISSPFSFPIWPILWMGFGRLASEACNNLRDIFFAPVSSRALCELSSHSFRHLHSLSLHFHTSRKTGHVLRSLDRGTTSISFLVEFFLFSFAPVVFEILLACAVLLSQYEPLIALIVFVVLFLYMVITYVLMESRLKHRRELNEANNIANHRAADSMLNAETVKYFANEEHEIDQYVVATEAYGRAQVKGVISLSLLNMIQGFIISAGIVGVIFFAVVRVQQGVLSVGDVVLVNSYILQLYAPISALGMSYRRAKTLLVDMENMFDLLEEQVLIQDVPNAFTLEVDRGEVQFENVHFAYPNGTEVLRGISFTCPAGKTVAIVGPSGQGKSTICKLLFRMYDVSGGRILIDGVDIRDVTQASLRRSISIVPQDTVLFNSSIGYNIEYGRIGASMDVIEEAAQLSHIYPFVMSLPKKFETEVGERGLRLSGGEKQRVSLGRCFLKQSRIQVFDEATSSLDSHTEREIQSSLDDLASGRTTIIIAHRLSTVIQADQILVLHQGLIIECGTHDELLSLGGEYASLWAKQIDKKENTDSLNTLLPPCSDASS